MCTDNPRNFAASLAALLLLAVPVAAATVDETSSTADPAMPAMLRLAMARSQAADVAAAYRLDREGRGANPRHGLELEFTSRGARIDGPAGGFALRLERFGRGAGRPVRRAAPRVDGAWVEYDRGAGLTEWFVNLPRGVEQGWTVAERPAGGGPLVLELDTARPPQESDEQRLAWSGLVYHRLVALDADGRELPAAWTADGARLRIEVDDRDAAYPLFIDPWVQQAKLVSDDGAPNDDFGAAVTLAGGTALVGAPLVDVDSNEQQGAVYVFTRSGGMWSQQAKLIASDGAAHHRFGTSLALAGDTALVGNVVGAAYVFIRSGDTWSQQDKLTPDIEESGDGFGSAVALADDTALVGAWAADVGGNGEQGAAYVFTRSDGTWSQQAKLIAADGAADERFGISVALASDVALVAAHQAIVDGNADQGAAYVFTRSGDTWSQQAKLVAGDGAAGDLFGLAVSLTGDTALVGTELADVGGSGNQGAAYVFTRNGNIWTQQAKLTAEDGAAGDFFGVSVALEGETALVGALNADVGGTVATGAAYVFTRREGVWSQQAEFTAADAATFDEFGSAVAMAGDTALVGAVGVLVGDNNDQGAAYVFFQPLTPTALAVDPEPMASADGNGVFEPGETVDVAPAWRNNGIVPLDVTGTASGFTGPPGAIYTLTDDSAAYGTLAPDDSASCLDIGACYAMGLDDPAAWPGTHWDARFDETLDDADGTGKTWTLHIGDSFADVPSTGLFYPAIETLLHSGITGGCAPGAEAAGLRLGRDPEVNPGTDGRHGGRTLQAGGAAYCPGDANTRAQMPVFVLRALLGANYTPPPCVEGDPPFDDVPFDNLFCPWIQDLAGRGIVAGCGGGDYCPSAPVTRAQMSIFLLKTLEGPAYEPPECKEVFTDVPCPSLFADWIEDLAARGITGGCAPNRYCPADAVTRAQMAVFVSRTFGFTLYGP